MIQAIRDKIIRGEYEFSQHATHQAIKRHIFTKEIREVILNGDIIEDYPDDKYGASCLIFGYTLHQRVIHVLCSYPERDLLKIITVYEPDPEKWINYRYRRIKQ